MGTSRKRGCAADTPISFGERVVLPAAGLPWFLTLFGRDTLITAYQTVAFGPLLARRALLAIAAYQGATQPTIWSWRSGCGPKPTSCAYGSTATSGSTNEAAITRSDWTGKCAGSTR